MGTKRCPICAEFIQEEAIKCKHCGEFVVTLTNDRSDIEKMVVGYCNKGLGASETVFWIIVMLGIGVMGAVVAALSD